MNKQIRLAACDASQPVHRRALSTSQPFELPSRPSCWGLVQMSKNLYTLRSIESAVVVDPSTYLWVDKPCQIFQVLLVPVGCHPPFAYGASDRVGGLGADRRKKAHHEELPPAILRPPRLKGVPQKSNEICSCSPFARFRASGEYEPDELHARHHSFSTRRATHTQALGRATGRPPSLSIPPPRVDEVGAFVRLDSNKEDRYSAWITSPHSRLVSLAPRARCYAGPTQCPGHHYACGEGRHKFVN
jgi:hypothetical protein